MDFFIIFCLGGSPETGRTQPNKKYKHHSFFPSKYLCTSRKKKVAAGPGSARPQVEVKKMFDAAGHNTMAAWQDESQIAASYAKDPKP